MEEPTEGDCCHSDCKNCVLDLYAQRKNVNRNAQQSSTNNLNLVMSQTRYKQFKLVQIDHNTPNTNVYTFESAIPNETMCDQLNFTPGQHVTLRNDPGDTDIHLSRPYTLIPWKCDNHPCSFSVAIKLYDDGQMSDYIRKWTVGDIAYWRGPYGDFIYKLNSYKKIIMICMGTGIAPMYAVAKHIVENEYEETTIEVLYGSKSPNDIIFRDEINKLSGYWNFHCTHFLSDITDISHKKFNEQFIEGRISFDEILKLYNESTHLFLICGSEGFNGIVEETLISARIPIANIFVFN